MKKLINKLLGKDNRNRQSDIGSTGSASDKALTFLNTEFEVTEQWLDVFTHFILLDEHNKMPTKDWLAELEQLIEKTGKESFVNTGTIWIKNCIEKSRENNIRFEKLGLVAAGEEMQINLGFGQRNVPEWVKNVYGDRVDRDGFIKMDHFAYLNNFQNYFYQSLGGRILRGFLHSAPILKDDRLIELVDEIALTNPNTSQDAIHVYTALPAELGVPKLTNLKAKVKNKNILSRINKAFMALGKKSGQTKEEIEESVIPDMGINPEGEFIQEIAGIKCVFSIVNIKTFDTYFLHADGKRQKTTPKLIRDEHANELKGFKKKVKDIKTSLNSQRKRIEEFYLLDRKMTFDNFKKHYHDNNLISILAKDLIWDFRDDKSNSTLIFCGRQLLNSDSQPTKKDLSACTVSLWHPIGHDSEEIIKWRNFVLNKEIVQPFKQAFREIYLITDAELNTKSYSNRYASHILNKDHVSALCKVRGWSPSGIINYGKATYKIPGTDLKAEYWVSEVFLGEYSKTYGSAHISTDQVRFYKKKKQLDLIEVPAILFSEVMRDVDLFVGVTSIGNDPEWYDRGEGDTQNYWSSYSNAELTERSKTRVEILKNIIPKMKIASVCEFDGKYLRVKGKIRNYKIHMGSGNILMEPNDQYLCIVADRSSPKLKTVFIPFEGDNMLSIIISKAILLANDDQIKDETIIRQIKSR